MVSGHFIVPNCRMVNGHLSSRIVIVLQTRSRFHRPADEMFLCYTNKAGFIFLLMECLCYTNEAGFIFLLMKCLCVTQTKQVSSSC